MALLISNRGTRMLLQAGVIFFTAVVPLAAQGIPPNPTPAHVNPSPLADTEALSREALVWLSQLIPINTPKPPGHEQAAAEYISRNLEKKGINPAILGNSPGRTARVAPL